ncbi:hypothetical protein A6F68_00515 [Tsuneonella dongtanensis]|uniref:Uncharacterized protein n=1 Tax=Tsuneonella dongtanensis TaxID=692370 RepID=A0A1B2AA62_9SPHN|nr:hypothetical protein [Tsuneonella dongtanensis]ANY19050.1 hypothetical protein A6F68_00515 [Tsuneonella dongtanensis]
MSAWSLAILQLAAAQPSAPLPDIELRANVRAREVVIRQQGEASLMLRADPGETAPVEVERSEPAGATRYRNLEIKLRGTAKIAPQDRPQQGKSDETISPR